MSAGTIAKRRMSYFVAGLTNTNPRIRAPVFKRYRYVRYNKKLPASATGSVSFPPSGRRFRYVIIQKKFYKKRKGAICMAEVKVFLRGAYDLFVVLIGLHSEHDC